MLVLFVFLKRRAITQEELSRVSIPLFSPEPVSVSVALIGFFVDLFYLPSVSLVRMSTPTSLLHEDVSYVMSKQ